jgi:hypothetical protein
MAKGPFHELKGLALRFQKKKEKKKKRNNVRRMCASLKGRNRDETVASSLSAGRRKKRRNRELIPLNTYYTKFAIYEDPTVGSSIRF